MRIRFCILTLVACFALVAGPESNARASDADDRRKAAAVVGILLGAAVLAASSRDHRHENHRSYSGEYRPQPNIAPFSPKRNVTCYPRQRTCYHRDGRVASGMTQRYFGAAPPQPQQPFRVQEANGNVTCYPQQRACYRANGKFAGKWTRRYFGG